MNYYFTGGKNMQCGPTQTPEWLRVTKQSAYVDYFYNKPRGSFRQSSEYQCAVLCQDESENCSLVAAETDCKWYESSPTYSYRTLFQTELEDTALIKLCPTGKPMK